MVLNLSRSLSIFLISTILLFAAANTAGAMEKTEDIDTNRPSFMFSPLVVPKGSLQLENGGLYQRFQHGTNYFDASETQIRLGLTKRAELQLFVPYYVSRQQAHSGDNLSGVTDLDEVGIKYQVGPLKKVQLCVIPSVNIPTGDRAINGPGVQGVLRAPWSYPLNSKLSIEGMQSILLLNAGRSIQYQPDFMLSRTIGKKASVFAEYVGFFTQQAQSIQITNFGGTYKLKPHHQVDMHFGFGLDKAAPAAFIGTGYSYRFDKLPW